MIVLHAGIKHWPTEGCISRSAESGEQSGLLLWGERAISDYDDNGVASQRASAKRTRRESGGLRPQAHPFAAGLGDLEIVLQTTIGREPTGIPGPSAVAWLPSWGQVPTPSGPLVGAAPHWCSNLVLMPWSVDCVPLSRKEAVELLCACSGRPFIGHGVMAGIDLAGWVQSLKLAGSLVARQHYLPGLEVDMGRYYARWKPVLAYSDASLLAELAKLMPAVARSLTHPDASAPPAVPAAQAFRQVTENLLDYLVRSAASSRGFMHVEADSRHAKGLTVHDRWLSALRSPDGCLGDKSDEVERLATQVSLWQRPAQMRASSVRLCFRLEEPVVQEPAVEAKDGPTPLSAGLGAWYVRYLLQSTVDPSLLVPVEDLWNTRKRSAAAMFEGINVREYLLYSLGQGALVCSRIEASLREVRPSGYELDTAGAYEFLTNKATALSQAGFGVMLPSWWTRSSKAPRLTARAKVRNTSMRENGRLSLERIVTVDWQLALGGEPLSLAELEELARLKAPLIKIRGKWVQVSVEEIQAMLAFWRRRDSGLISAQRLLRIALGAEDLVGGVSLDSIEAHGWIGEMLQRLSGDLTLKEMPVPAGFAGTLRAYQIRGYSWLSYLRQYGLGACLADDMGLGKTVQTLAFVQNDWDANAAQSARRPVLLVCPTSVVHNWQKEAARFVPNLPVMVYHGPGRAKGDAFTQAANNSAMVITSYSILSHDLEHLNLVSWAGVILDEAQNIKNSETKQARAARMLEADFRIALTGTPVENSVGDLWSIFEFLNPGLLGTRERFKREFYIPIQVGNDPEAPARLKRITAPFILRRLKTDKAVIADLPDKTETKILCTLTKEQASLYVAVVKEAEETLANADGIERKGLILATLTRIKQVCNHPAQFLADNSPISGRSGKLTRLAEILEEAISVGDSALVFTQFAQMGEILRRHLRETLGVPVYFLHGGVPKKQRDRMVEQFQDENNRSCIFVLSLKAGGTGLNLTRANHVFHFDRWWNPAVENQATDRAFRIGQSKNVLVHKFVCAGTLEERIDEMIERKREVSDAIVGTGEGWLTNLSNKELRDIFALRREAIGE